MFSFPDSSVGKESICNAADPGLIPGPGRFTEEGIGYPLQYSGLENFMDCRVQNGEGNGTPLQYFCLENPMDGGAWKAPRGCWGLDTTERLHFHFSLSCIGEGNGSPLQCSCLENPRDEGAWWAAIYGVVQSRTWLKWLSSSRSSA